MSGTSETLTRKKGGAPKLLTSVEHVAAALKASAGLKTSTAQKLGVSRSTLYRFLDEHPELKEIANEVTEEMLDLAESNVITALKASDIHTTRWFLETKGKHRGYTRQLNLAGKDGGPVQVEATFDVTTLSTGALRELEAAMISQDVADAE